MCFVLLSSCGKKEDSAKPANDGQNVSGDSKVSREPDEVTITGSGESTTPKIAFEPGCYILEFKYKSDNPVPFDALLAPLQQGFPAHSLAPYSGFAKNASGWYSESKIMDFKSSKSYLPIIVKTSVPWEIKLKKLPLVNDNALETPAVITGYGTQVTQAVKLNKGSATFEIKCPDTKKAGFMITLFNNLGKHVLPSIILASNVEPGANPKETSYGSTKKINIPYQGIYFLEIAANGTSAWEVKISQ